MPTWSKLACDIPNSCFFSLFTVQTSLPTNFVKPSEIFLYMWMTSVVTIECQLDFTSPGPCCYCGNKSWLLWPLGVRLYSVQSRTPYKVWDLIKISACFFDLYRPVLSSIKFHFKWLKMNLIVLVKITDTGMKHHDQNHLGEKRVYFTHSSM